MANENDPAPGAEQRFVKERDEALSQLAEATRTLDQYRKRDAAFVALNGKVKDPFHVADLLAPHLGDVKVEDVAAHVTSEAFAPRLAAFQAADAQAPTPPPGEGEGAPGEGTPPAATETPGFGGGPSFGAPNGMTQPTGEEKIVVGSAEYWALINSNDRDAVQAAFDAGRIIEPVKGY